MKTISIEGTQQTPTVRFDVSKGLLEIKGSSVADNAIEFYKPLLDWIEKYAAKPRAKTSVIIQLKYIHTDSLKCILELLKKLEVINKVGSSKVLVNWHYEDGATLEAGEDYRTIINLPFKMIQIV